MSAAGGPRRTLRARRTLIGAAWLAAPALLAGGCRAPAQENRAPSSEVEASPPAALSASFPGRDPALAWDAAGDLHVLYVEEGAGEGKPAVVYRRLGGEPAGPVRVSPSGLAVAAHGEAPPVLALLADGGLVAAYPVALPGRWKSEIRVQRSDDGGATWGLARLLHGPRGGSHSYLSAAAPAGRLVFAWLDDRAGQMGLQTAASADGRAFSAPRTLDAKTCECCGTALLAGRSGELWAAYRDQDEGDVRDLRLLRAESAGSGFGSGTELSRDGWTLEGCPHTGPRLAQDGEGVLWAAWFTGAGSGGPGVYVTSSRDGGRSFAPRAPVAASPQARHPEIGLLPNGRLAVLYERAVPGGAQRLAFRLRDPRTGRWSAERAGPPGIYPRLAVAGGRAAVAFTCRAGDGKGTRVAVADWRLIAAGKTEWEGCSTAAVQAGGHHG